MANYYTTEDWIYKDRVDIYDKTKNMSLKEYHEYYRERSEF